MPSFDVVSEVDRHELSNAVDQTNREIGNRFDFKGSNAKVNQEGENLLLDAQSEFQLGQVKDILLQRMAKRGIDIQCLDEQPVDERGGRAYQALVVREGIEKELAKKITKLVKESKLKVQAAVQAEQVRVSGNKRDDLQQVIALLRGADLGLPLQFKNFRD